MFDKNHRIGGFYVVVWLSTG